jgi:hypothetical protein
MEGEDHRRIHSHPSQRREGWGTRAVVLILRGERLARRAKYPQIDDKNGAKKGHPPGGGPG